MRADCTLVGLEGLGGSGGEGIRLGLSITLSISFAFLRIHTCASIKSSIGSRFPAMRPMLKTRTRHDHAYKRRFCAETPMVVPHWFYVQPARRMAFMDKRYFVGGVLGAMVAGTVLPAEVCERDSASASACSAPRVEWDHTHTREPQGPSFAHQSYVLGTGTDTRGNMQGIGISASMGTAALTLRDAQGNVVAS